MSILKTLRECIEFYEICSQNSNAGCFNTSVFCLEKKLEDGVDLYEVMDHEIMNLKMLQSKFSRFDFDPIISKLEAIKSNYTAR